MNSPARAVLVAAAAGGRLRVVLPWMRGDERVASAVEHHLSGMEGVRAVRVYPRSGNVVVWHEPATLNEPAIRDLLATGLDVAPIPRPIRIPPQPGDVEIARLVVGGAVLALAVVRRFAVRRRTPLLSRRGSTVALLVSIFTGYPFVRGAVRSLTGRTGGGTDLLVTVATVASLLLRENVVALTVLWLLNIGEFLQELTLRRTRRAIEDLLSLGEDQVWLVTDDGVEVRVPLEEVAVGDVLACYEHSAIGVDGEVVDGEGVVDQAPITGEPLPAYVTTGGQVYAGTILVRGTLRVRATAVGADTTVGRIITRVEQAQTDRAPIQTVATQFSRRFVPASLALAALTYLLTRDARRAMTMLLVACPCAAGLSTPTAINAAIGNGARRGILIKGGTHLEAAGRLTAVAFDKTGTLTIGRPLVTNVISFNSEWSPERVLAVAASSEVHIRHPLAEAVVRHTAGRDQLIDGGVDRRVLPADAETGEEPAQEEVPGHGGERGGHRGHQVDRQREHEELLAAAAVRQLTEQQGAEAGTGDVECAGRPDVGGTHADPAARLGQPRGHGSHDRDLEAVQNPDRAEADDDPPVEA